MLAGFSPKPLGMTWAPQYHTWALRITIDRPLIVVQNRNYLGRVTIMYCIGTEEYLTPKQLGLDIACGKAQVVATVKGNHQ
jgi:hypothetical protein